MNKLLQHGLLATLVISLAGCGGGGGSTKAATSTASVISSVTSVVSSSADSSSMESSSTQSSAVATETGVFIDSAVSGIGYKTSPGMLTGTTDANGQYNFAAGDSVTFFIGALEFPAVTAKATVTPFNIAKSEDSTNLMVINIARLLQSLDADGDVTNGISIPAGAADIASNDIDFNLSVADFAAQSAVTNLVANSGSVTTTLINEIDAIDHLGASVAALKPSLIGSWVAGGDVLTFIDETHYVMVTIGDEPNGHNGTDGLEYGTYSWNSNGAFTATPYEGLDTNGEWGLSHSCNGGTRTLTLNGNNSLVLTESDTSCGNNINGSTLQRVTSTSNPMVGGWIYQSKETLPTVSLFALTILNGNHYMLAEIATQDSEDYDDDEGSHISDIEYGSYTISNSGQVHFNIAIDTNPNMGFSGSQALEYLTLTGANQLQFTSKASVDATPEDNAPLSRVIKTDNASGTWVITGTEDDSQCGGSVSPFEDIYTVEQDGYALTVTNAAHEVFQGNITGGKLYWAGMVDEDGGTTNLKVTTTILGSALSGTSTWSWGDDTDSCEGTTTFTGHKQ